jgi:hypothetical protein
VYTLRGAGLGQALRVAYEPRLAPRNA